MSRFLRLCAFLSVLFFANNVMAAGYTCSTTPKYTSCKSGYYLSDCGTTQSAWTGQTVTPASGNSCVKCPTGYNCDGGTKCPVKSGIVCNPGQYIPAGSTECTICPYDSYCPGITTNNNSVSTSDRGINPCPSIGSTTTRTTYPEKYYSNEGMSITNMYFPTWITGNAAITDCRVIYNGVNNRGKFTQESVRYQTSSGKYDGAGGTVYYRAINPGYYGSGKLTPTYCENPGSKQMLYKDVIVCPAGKYCEGYKNGVPLCSSGTYNDTLGITGDIAAGYWANATCGAITSKPSKDTDCALGNANNSKAGLIHFGFYSTGGGKVPRPYPDFAAGEACLDGYECGYVGAGYYVNGGGTSKNPSGFGNGCVGQWNNAGTMTNHVCGQVSPGYFSTGGAISATPATNDCHGYDVADTTDVIANRCGLIAAGYYGGSGATSNTGSGKVNAGYYSTGGGTSATPTANGNGCVGSGKTCGLIAAGYYGGSGATTSSGSGLVNAGYYSTGGGTSKTPTANGNGCVGSGKTCGKVNSGYYSTGGGTSKTPTKNGAGCVGSGKTCGLIDEGCFGGAGSISSCPNSCSDKTGGVFKYSKSGAYDVKQCFAIGTELLGVYVQNNKIMDCPAGSFNDGLNDDGSEQVVFHGTSSGCDKCYAGYYCPEKTADPIVCIAPYKYSDEGSESRGDCYAICSAGEAVFEPTKSCTSDSMQPWYTEEHPVHYGSVSGVTYWPDYFSDVSSNIYAHDAPTDSYLSAPAGYYAPGGGLDVRYIRLESPDGAVPLAYINLESDTPLAVTGIYNGDTKDIVDDDPSTSIVISNTPGGVIFDFGKVHENADSLKFALGGIAKMSTITIQVSQDSKAWFTVFNQKVSGYDSQYVDYAKPTKVNLPRNIEACEAGTYQPGVLTVREYNASTTKCLPVDAGYYNEGCGTSASGSVCKTTISGGLIAAGYYGGAGATSNTGSGKVNAGYYSTGGGTSATPTANGNGCVGSGKTCGLIAAGYYGGAGATTSSGSGKVDAGYYSTGGGTSKTPTENGNGCVGSGKTCGMIAGGYYGVAGATTSSGSGTVDAGYYSTGGGTSATPTANGNGCVGDGTACGLIAAGYWSAGGAFIDEPFDPEWCIGGKCGACHISKGEYSTGGATSCSSCPAVTPGWEYAKRFDDIGTGFGTCTQATIPDGCAAGSVYVSAISATAWGTSRSPYQWAESGSSVLTAKPGYYRTSGSAMECKLCPAGTYSTGGKVSSCAPVAAGYWNNGCGTSGTGNVCSADYSGGLIAAGYYGGSGATSNTGSGKVNAGYYSTGGGTSATPTANGNGCVGSGKTCGTIAAGYYGGSGATSATGSGTVFAGHFSTGGATNNRPTANDCVGKKSDGTANTCGLVAAGYWTSHGSKTATPTNSETDCVNKLCGILDAGYYSTGGATRSAPTEIGNHCFGTACGRVDAGYYSTGGGTSAFGSCISGRECGLIKLGLYSTCGATSAGDTGGNLADKDYLDCVSGCECGRVDAGYYSTGGGTSKTPNGNGDGCIGDGNTCGTVDPGYYSRGGAGNAQPTGYFCWGYNTYSDGITGCGRVAAGYYSNGGGTMPNGTCVSGKSCGPVAAGYYATGGATSNTGNGQVAGGYFATGGATKADPSSSDCVGSGNTCGLISGGYWSVSGAKTATPTAKTDCIGMGDDNEYCGVISGGYYSTAGATYKYPATQGVDCVGDSACGKVKPGYYNNGCGINDAGSVCDTTKYEGGVVPAGYYTTGGSSMSPVAAGYYSTGGGTSATGTCLSGYKCGTVDGGYYSTGGGTSANGKCIGGKSCGLIDAGYYSTGGAKKANPYLSNSCVGKKSDGTANTCGLVNGGYYSTGGATNPTPTANGNGCVGSGKTCGKVAVAYYSNGGGTSANGTCIEGQVCGTCNSNYRAGTLTGKTTESQCQASCAAGKRVAEPYAACSEPAGAWFTPAHLVDYGHISPVNYCMDGYQLNNESHTGSVTSCARNLSDGQYMPSTQIAARYIKVTSGGSAQNSDTHMLEIQAFASNDGTGTNLLSGKGGNTGSKLTAATNGSWTRGAGESYAQGTDLIWDLGSVQKLGSLKFAMYTDGRVYRNLVIAVSENNQDYTTVFQDADFQTQNATEPTPDMVVLSALPKSCESGTVNPGKKVLLTQTSSCTACMGRTQFANTISQVCTTIEEGKYTTGCDANGNKCASAKWCDGAEYCVAGVRYDCPAPETNWTAGTGSGWTNVTQCNEYINAKNISTDCSSGQLVRNAKTATEWASEFTEKVAFKADPGAYIDRSGSLPTCTLCVVGSYSAGGTATACTACPAGKTNSSSNLSTCTVTCSNSAGVASDGWETTKWNTDNTVTNLCTIKSNGCSANNYKNSNACSTCSSATNSLYTLSAAGATSKNDCYLEPTATKYVASAGAGQVSCAKGGYCPGSTTANPIKIYFGGTHSSTHPTTGGRTQCPAGSYCTAGVSAATTCTTLGGGLYKNSDAGSDEQTDCHFTTTGGYYIDASTDTAEKECEANYYCEATKLNYPNTGSRASCPDPTVSTNVETISDVAWLSTACPDATTSNSSVQYAKWQTWGNTKLKSKSACPVLMYVDTPCAIFQIQSAKFNTTTGKYDADSSSTRIASVVKAGYYFTEPYTSTYCTTSPTALMYYKTAAKCPENSYCPGATVPKCNSGEHVYGEPFGKYACSSLGAFYTTSAAGAKTDTACYGTTTKTKYIAKANDATESVCAENGYCQGGVSVNYGSTGGRTACSGSYTLAASGSDDANDCYLKTTAGSYVKSAGAGQTTCPAGSWCVGNVVIYKGGSVSGRNTSGGSQQCPAGYQDGTTGYSLESQCLMNVDGGHYVASAKESTASGTCQPGYAKAAHPVTYGETSSCDPCKNATYAKDSAQESCTACPTVSGASSYGYWNTNGKEGDHTVRDGCNATFKNPTLDDGTLTGYSCYIDTNADTYGKNGNGKGCWVNKSSLKCNGGYYNKKFNDNPSATQDIISPYATELIANVCRPVEENYYSPADSLTRTACASGLTTCGSGLCANEAGDCGRKLHAGDKVIHLRSEKRTTPTMVVNIGGTKFYGNLGAAIANSLRVKNGTNNYSVVNDNQ